MGSASAICWTDRPEPPPSPSSSTILRRFGSPSASNGSPARAVVVDDFAIGLLRPHPVVLRIVRQLREPERLEQRRQVHPEPAPVALPEAVPSADRVVRVPAPCLDGPLGRRLLLV